MMEPELKSLEPYVVVDGVVLARDGTVLYEPLNDPLPPPRMVPMVPTQEDTTEEMTEDHQTSTVTLRKISKVHQEVVFELKMPLPVVAEMLCEAVRSRVDQPQTNHNG
jgi:hypothetical protein